MTYLLKPEQLEPERGGPATFLHFEVGTIETRKPFFEYAKRTKNLIDRIYANL